MSWLTRILPDIKTRGVSGKSEEDEKEASAKFKAWTQCEECQHPMHIADFVANLRVCTECDHHHKISARERLGVFFDEGQEVESLAEDVVAKDRLKFRDVKRYPDRLKEAAKSTGESEACIVQVGSLKGQKVVAVAFEFRFLGGSMGGAVGERFAQAADYALEHGAPMVCFATSGGARMQESMISLLQMAKSAAVIQRLNDAGVPYISVMVNPVFGGVSASLSMLGDFNIAEPNAFVGFSGPRVIEDTIGAKLPEGYQRAPFLLEHGAIDAIVPREDQRDVIHRIISKLQHRSFPAKVN